MDNDGNERLSPFAYDPDYTYGYPPNRNRISVHEPYWQQDKRDSYKHDSYSYERQYSLFNDPTYQAWIKERGAPPDCAALWQEACADFFFLQECDGKCSICKKLIHFKGGLK